MKCRMLDGQDSCCPLFLSPLFDHEPVTLRTCVNRQQPFGREDWQANIAATLGLESTMRQRGRPRKPLEK